MAVKDSKNIHLNDADSKNLESSLESSEVENFKESTKINSNKIKIDHIKNSNDDEISSDKNSENKSNNKSNGNESNSKKSSDNEAQNIDSKNYTPVINAAYYLSVGLSMVVAVILGLGIGWGLYKLTGLYWFIFIGLIYGILAAFLNVFKAYKRLQKDSMEIQNETKYKYMQEKFEKEKSNKKT